MGSTRHTVATWASCPGRVRDSNYRYELAYYINEKEFQIGGGPAEVIDLRNARVTIHDASTLVPRRLMIVTESNE